MTENEKTAPISSVGADEGQSSNTTNIIAQNGEKSNSQNDFYRIMVRKTLNPNVITTRLFMFLCGN